MNHNLTDKEFLSVCEVISNYLGLNFLNEKKHNLSRKLANAAGDFGFHDVSSFIRWLLSAEVKRDQIEILASYLANSETYFWREPMVFDSLTQNIINELIELKKGGEKKLNIWCAGCSTGEEAYSIAIALRNTIPKIKEWNIAILATDLNSKSISKARLGIYTSWSFRNSPAWLKSKYFETIDETQYKIIPQIKKMVTFSNFNLTKENYLSTICKNQKMDIIFCRNVLMYFKNEWAVKASRNFFDSLTDNGWLAVASCELSSELYKNFTPVNFPGAVLYRKTAGPEAEIAQPFNHSTIQPFISEPAIEFIHQVSPSTLQLLPAIALSNNLQSINDAEAKADIQLLKPIEKAPGDILNENLISIRLLADQGRLEEALLVCNETIENDKLIPGLYYLKASILQEQNKSSEAVKSLKQAIYIDPDHIMGHFTLGNIFIRKGIIKEAERHFNNALMLLNNISNDSLPAESDGFSARYIRGIILDRLQTQKPI